LFDAEFDLLFGARGDVDCRGAGGFGELNAGDGD
jgi:hypothetical protein